MDTEFVSPLLAIREIRSELQILYRNDSLIKTEVEDVLLKLDHLEGHLKVQTTWMQQVAEVLQEHLHVVLPVPGFEPLYRRAVPPATREEGSNPEGKVDLDALAGFTLKPLPEE